MPLADSHVSLAPFVPSYLVTFMAQLDYQERYQVLAHKSGINAIVLSTDGRRFVTGSNDSTVILWSTGSAAELCHIKAHSPVVSLAWLTNSRTFVFGCKNGMLVFVEVLEVCPNLHIKLRFSVNANYV
jgi:WD40 repeat protein